jgi:type VI secretion system secreted protein Hcp
MIMAYDTFLDLQGVEGESTAKDMTNKIEIYSFSLGASNPTTVSSGAGGLSGGKVSVSSFNLMKKADKASPKLFQACCTGKHFSKATVTLRKATGDSGQKAFLTFDFTDVMVESVQWSGSSGGDDTPTESLSLAFGKVDIKYQPQDSKGGNVGSAIEGAWDLMKVTAK